MEKFKATVLAVLGRKIDDRMMKGDDSMLLVRKHRWLLFALVIATFNPAFADPVEKHQKTPHGGMIREAEGLHAEFLIDKNGEPKLFLYDKAMKPLDRSDLQARLTVKAHGGTEHARDLKFAKDATLGALFKGEPIKGLTDWDTAVVSLKVKDRWTHIRFSHH